MYNIKSEFCEDLLQLSGKGYPKRKVIEKYKKRVRAAQENTVHSFASLLVNDWKDLAESKYVR